MPKTAAAASAPDTFPLTVEVYTHADNGQKYLLPAADNIAIQRKQLERDTAEADEEKDEAKRAALLERLAFQRKMIERSERIREKFLGHPNTEVTTYSIRRPSYGEFSEIEEASTDIDTGNGSVRRIPEKMGRAILADAIVGMTEDEALALFPPVARLIVDRRTASAYPDTGILDFFD